MVLRTNLMPNLNLVQCSEFFRSIWTVCTTCWISLLRCIMKVKITSRIEKEYSKTTKNHPEIITKRKRKAAELAQNTNISKVIKRFTTLEFTYLDKWQFVLNFMGISFLWSWFCVQRKKISTKCVKKNPCHGLALTSVLYACCQAYFALDKDSKWPW